MQKDHKFDIIGAEVLHADIASAKKLRAEVASAEVLRADLASAEVLRAESASAEILRAEIIGALKRSGAENVRAKTIWNNFKNWHFQKNTLISLTDQSRI